MNTKELLDYETNKYISLQACITDVMSDLIKLRKLEELNDLTGLQIQRKAVLEASLVELKEMGKQIGDNICRLRQREKFYHYE